VLAARALSECGAHESGTEAKRKLAQAIEAVAGVLGNTRTVCRKCYVHPAVIDAYLDKSLVETLEQRADAAVEDGDLRPDEMAVLRFLRKRLKSQAAA
jgi:DNA topoisomerase-1